MWKLLLNILTLTVCLPALAGEADVLQVEVTCDGNSVCRFDVTVKHEDQGWDHYANRWEILSPEGEVLATRVLAHPHENEQPFTRSLPDVKVPADMPRVIVRAHDSVHEYGGREVHVEVPR